MSSEDLLKKGVIKQVKPSDSLVEHALNKSRHDLDVSKSLIELNEYDWAYTAAYTAMLSAARAYMNNRGYRPSSNDGHVAVVRFFRAEAGFEEYTDILDRMRRNRHRVMYDDYDIISLRGAEQAYKWAYEFVEFVQEAVK